MSQESVAVVKSSWAGWRQGIRRQMVRDLDEGLAERMREWSEAAGKPDLQPEEFIDCGDVVLVRARASEAPAPLWFRYVLDGTRIVGWEVHRDEREARQATNA